MPIKNGKVFCINHPNIPMVRNAGFNAITTVENTASGFSFSPTTGIPVVVFFCNECGYIETYAAQKTLYWNELTSSRERSLTSSAQEFESKALNALLAPDSPFHSNSITQHVPLRTGNKHYEADAIMHTLEATYVFEFKSTASKTILESAAAQARNNAELYAKLAPQESSTTPVLPVIIAPSAPTTENEVLGVPVLKYNPNTQRFENAETIAEILRSKRGKGSSS